MARAKKYRSVQMAPQVCGFKPLCVHVRKAGETLISFAEYEALKLCDYEQMRQEEAALLMNVSRPTFTRIYQSVRKKVATAFVEGRGIKFEEGKATLAKWYTCEICQIVFTISDMDKKECPFCHNSSIDLNCLGHETITVC
jgi:uncharacterized protein